jgi:hypothetical protein
MSAVEELQRARTALRRAAEGSGLVILEAPDRASFARLLQQTAIDLDGSSLIVGAGELDPTGLARRLLDGSDRSAGADPASEFEQHARAHLCGDAPLLVAVDGAEALPPETVRWLASFSGGSTRLLRVILGTTDYRRLTGTLSGSGTCVDLIRLRSDGASTRAPEIEDPAAPTRASEIEDPAELPSPPPEPAEAERSADPVGAQEVVEPRLRAIEELLSEGADPEPPTRADPAPDAPTVPLAPHVRTPEALPPEAESRRVASISEERDSRRAASVPRVRQSVAAASAPAPRPTLGRFADAALVALLWVGLAFGVGGVMLGVGLYQALLNFEVAERSGPSEPDAGGAIASPVVIESAPPILARAESPTSEPAGPPSQPRSGLRPAEREGAPSADVAALVEGAIEDLLREDSHGVHQDAIERLVGLGPELAGPELFRQINARRKGVRRSAALRTIWIRARGALCEEVARDPEANGPPELVCPPSRPRV